MRCRFWDIRTPGNHEGPMFFPGCPLSNPPFQQLFLILTQWFVRLFRRHNLIRIDGPDTLQEQTVLRITGNDNRIAGTITQDFLTQIQAQTSLAMSRVWTMTLKTMIRKDR